jgi:hypothetical protein
MENILIFILSLVTGVLFIIYFIQNLMDNKQENTKIMHRTISDMDSEGVYFTDEDLKRIQKEKEEMYCEYSGLPSVKSYE